MEEDGTEASETENFQVRGGPCGSEMMKEPYARIETGDAHVGR